MTSPRIRIGGREIGGGRPTYIVAEMSANHGNKIERALRIIEEAHQAGADAIKVQTYLPDTITLDCDSRDFRIEGTLWEGRRLYDLYAEASMPWEWQPKLKQAANDLGMDFFSTPFDDTAVDFLESLDVPAYKVASFEIVDLPLLKRIAKTGKPVILSTGMATREEIAEAIQTLRDHGSEEIVILKCNSAYPAPPEDMNLRTMLDMSRQFGTVVGLSDHTLGIAVPVAAVSLGASLIEKHFTLSRNDPGPDSAFSLEPAELAEMVRSVRTVEAALGEIRYGPTDSDRGNLMFRRSLYAAETIEQGGRFDENNVRVVRPGHGLLPRFLPRVLGCRAACRIEAGTPLSWDAVESDETAALQDRESESESRSIREPS